MLTTLEITLLPSQSNNREEQLRAIAAQLSLPSQEVRQFRVCKRSIDARQRPIVLRLKVEVAVGEDAPSSWEEVPLPHYKPVSSQKTVIIVGAGPAGLFAALRLIELGIKPVVIERGKDVRARRRDLKAIQRDGIVNPDSNYCFGEGGAGTYSDGKLYTRSTKRGNIQSILKTFVAHGASPDILIDAHPHIGSNKLPEVVTAIRESILKAGGEIHFEHRVTDFIITGDNKLRGVVTSQKEFVGEAVILATGHSARDIFKQLLNSRILIEAKPFAVGVRIEHPQPLIDRIQYRTAERDINLPAASYSLVTNIQSRGVFSFCMCPGGFIVPSATEPDEVVVNGMSLSRRDSPFANSGMVVSVEVEDLEKYKSYGPLAGIYFQREMEVMAAQTGAGMQRAPGQRMIDFLNGRGSSTLPACSYHPGLTSAPLHELLPLSISKRLQEGLKHFGKTMKGYLTEDAVLIGVETRTSSPVRVPRDPKSLEHPIVKGLFPCGEGAGYAGGIISAAMDGVRVAEAIQNKLF